MRMEMTFPGGAAVEARFHGFIVRTDQPARSGGAGSAPAPFDLFLASIGTCAGYYALQFLKQRQMDPSGLEVSLEAISDPERRRVGTVRIDLVLPEGFPEKYRDAIVRAVDQCAVKRHILEPPGFEVTAEIRAAGAIPAATASPA